MTDAVMSALGGAHPFFIIGGLIVFIFAAAGIGIKLANAVFYPRRDKDKQDQ